MKLENLGVVELNEKEMVEIDGGEENLGAAALIGLALGTLVVIVVICL